MSMTVEKRVNENKLYYEFLLDYEEYEDEYDGSGAKIRFYRTGNMEFQGFLSDEFGYLKLMHKEIGKFVVYCGFLYDSENLIEYADDKWEELLSSK